MPRCEQCQRDFDTEEGLAQHNRDKHGIGKITKHELKEKKREDKEKQKEAETKKQKSGKRLRTAGIIAVVVIVLAGIGYFVSTLPSSSSSGNYDLTGFPNSFVHWHADVDVIICGEDKRLPEASVGDSLGTSRLHTHDSATNIQSLPGSDGNGVVHTEGNVRQAPQEHTLERFMRNIGIKFDNETIMDKKNGDACNGTAGTLKVLLNDQLLDNFLDYLPRDRDVIRIEFS